MNSTKEANNVNTFNAETLASQLLQEIDKLRSIKYERKSMSTEMRTLEFWRAIIAECLATFFYVFLVCAVQITWTGTIGEQPNHVVIALTTGFAMATLTQCFGHISGAHVNPSVTFSLLITRKITPLRAALYVIAQCGGSIAGAALLYG
ncbi:neurogenic protein big brain-like protein [Leptotrombidium deliense]|uniref:Neurogenic protein big brain-like protein n=1 Tax=Leptotrombidium deliense TaxID=299467 RepID=A0A443S2W8_9ACAR|nr:neurogenic protein big brain-like protein [Leptotrombidium deliense]